MRSLALYVLLFGIGTINSNIANAATVFSQSPLDGGVSFGAFLTDQITDDFILSSDSSVTSIKWWGGEGLPTTPISDSFSVRFFSDSGTGTPEIDPFITLEITNPSRIETELNAFPGQPIFEYESSLPQTVSLLEDETYYISILSTGFNYGWAASETPGTSWTRTSDSSNWSPRLSPSADLAFELNSENGNGEKVPETNLITALITFSILSIKLKVRQKVEPG